MLLSSSRVAGACWESCDDDNNDDDNDDDVQALVGDSLEDHCIIALQHRTVHCYLQNRDKTEYHKNHKISDTRKIIVIALKVEQRWGFLRVMHPKDASKRCRGNCKQCRP